MPANVRCSFAPTPLEQPEEKIFLSPLEPTDHFCVGADCEALRAPRGGRGGLWPDRAGRNAFIRFLAACGLPHWEGLTAVQGRSTGRLRLASQGQKSGTRPTSPPSSPNSRQRFCYTLPIEHRFRVTLWPLHGPMTRPMTRSLICASSARRGARLIRSGGNNNATEQRNGW